MMKFYRGTDCENGVHTIKVSLQFGEHRGAFTYEVGGNGAGLAVLEFSPECEVDEDFCSKIKSENLKLSITEYDEICVKFLETGATLYFDLSDFENLITGIEIVAYQARKVASA